MEGKMIGQATVENKDIALSFEYRATPGQKPQSMNISMTRSQAEDLYEELREALNY